MPKNALAPTSKNRLDDPQTLDAEVQRVFGLDPTAERSTLLPFYSQRTGWIAPEIVYQAAKAVVAPGFAWRGGTVTPEEAMNVASTVGGGGLAASAVKPAPVNALGMFVGRRAKEWNMRAMQNAELLEKAGVSPEEIWRRWGTWRGPDGEWRQEISDAALKLTVPFEGRRIFETKENLFTPQPLTNLVEHPEFLRNYPDAARINTVVYQSPKTSTDKVGFGQFSGIMSDSPYQWANLTASGKTENDVLNTVAHELQHAVQSAEKFAGGGTPDALVSQAAADLSQNPAFAALPAASQTEAVNALAVQRYRLLMGEAEARATAARRQLSPEERRARFPALDYDVPLNLLRR